MALHSLSRHCFVFDRWMNTCANQFDDPEDQNDLEKLCRDKGAKAHEKKRASLEENTSNDFKNPCELRNAPYVLFKSSKGNPINNSHGAKAHRNTVKHE